MRCHVFGVNVYMNSQKVWNVMYACAFEQWRWVDFMRWHMFGVLVIHEFPKGSECHVCMCDWDMTLIELVGMLYIWSACIFEFSKGSECLMCMCSWVITMFDLLRCKVLDCMYLCISQRFGRNACVYSRDITLNVFL
jgi:hypothetical protein